jgi:alkaline phosphatase D
VSRRLLLKGLGFSGSSALLLSACGGENTASGGNAKAVSGQSAPVDVTLEIYNDAGLKQLHARRCTTTSAARDYTVKLDVDGLEAASTGVSALKFGVVSCSSLAHGFFNAYAQLAKRTDIDAIIHLGDYIYEYASGEYGDIRPYEPATEIKTLSEYRIRHSHYKMTDADLQTLHSLFPFITIWDDHESANNSYRDGAENHTEGAESTWPQRKGGAQQAYDEWMPIRLPEAGNTNKIWRQLKYGNLLVSFNDKQASCEYWYVDTITERGGSECMGKKFTVLAGENKISDTPGLSF